MVVVVLSAGVVVGDAVVVEELDGDEVGEDDSLDVGDGYEESDERDDDVGEWDKVWGDDEYQECAKWNEM
jgi:hypothetical protein